MAKTGRPVTKKGKAAARHRAASRSEYQSLTPAERKARVAARDKEAQRKADAKRLAKDPEGRRSYHREQAKARSKAPKKPANCQWPGCSSTDIEFHHQGTDRWLCPRHHAMARRGNGNR